MSLPDGFHIDELSDEDWKVQDAEVDEGSEGHSITVRMRPRDGLYVDYPSGQWYPSPPEAPEGWEVDLVDGFQVSSRGNVVVWYRKKLQLPDA